MASRIRDRFLISLVEVALRCARRLWRVQLIDKPSDETGPHLYAFWDGDELLLVPVFANRGYAILSSRSRDGGLMTQLLTRLGYRVVRGSSSKGAVAGLKGLVDVVRKEKRSVALAVDGPRGPVFQVKPGILFLAQATSLPVVPAAAFASRKWFLKNAWNKGYVPKLLSRCVVLFGEPLPIPQDCSELEPYRLELEERLKLLKIRAEQALDLKNPQAFKQLTTTPASVLPPVSQN